MSASMDEDKFNFLFPDASSHIWKGSIFLPVYPYDQWDEDGQPPDLQSFFDVTSPPHDICEYLNSEGQSVTKLYFDPKAYPPIYQNGNLTLSESDKTSLKDLNALIISAAASASSPVSIIDGCLKGKKLKSSSNFYRTYGCKTSNPNNNRKKTVREQRTESTITGSAATAGKENSSNSDMSLKSFRKTTLVNNERGDARRHVGRGAPGLPRKVNKPLRLCKCPFTFTLRVDDVAFYISVARSSGNPIHKGHPSADSKFAPTQMSSMTNEEREDAVFALKAAVNKASGRNFMAMKWNKNLSHAQMQHLECLSKEVGGNELESLLDMFQKSTDIRFNILWTSSLNSDNTHTVMSSTAVLGEVTEDPLQCVVGDKDPDGLRPVLDEAVEERSAREIDASDQAFHCITFANERLLRYFLLCPEAVTLDITSHTNKSGFHLLSFSCKTSIDKQVVFVRVWLPNQRRVSFRYAFRHALVKLIPEHARRRVHLVMKDGDFQQDAELRLAIKECFGDNAIIAGCAFHIVTKGWNRNVLAASNLHGKSEDMWKVEVRRMQTWLYSFMRSGYCETKEEFEISKYLLMKYISSSHLLKLVGGPEFVCMIKSVVDFVTGYFFPYEDLIAHYLRKKSRNLEVSTSSAQEGIHHGYKSHAAAVKPTQGLDSSAAALAIQDSCKANELDKMVGKDFICPDKSAWSNTPTANHLLTHAEGLLANTYDRMDQYLIRRVGEYRYLVVYVGPTCDPDFVRTYITDWSRDTTHSSSSSAVNVDSTVIDNSIGVVEVAKKKKSFRGNNTWDDEIGEKVENCKVPLFSRAYEVVVGKNGSKCLSITNKEWS